ncbi:MAG TPA: hypothetical protein VLM37_11795 [Fibrobacteraceae bacterium]|nr:hypothetical protein [Fibrobacteraceae bacterium]
MRIEGLIAAYSAETIQGCGSNGRTKGRSGTSAGKSDSVQISEEARKKLDRIRKRLNDGFYDSESVAEDISDKLSGVLDQLS